MGAGWYSVTEAGRELPRRQPALLGPDPVRLMGRPRTNVDLLFASKVQTQERRPIHAVNVQEVATHFRPVDRADRDDAPGR